MNFKNYLCSIFEKVGHNDLVLLRMTELLSVCTVGVSKVYGFNKAILWAGLEN